MNKMIKNKWLLLIFLLLPVLSGCNDTDDVQQIFTGKTWKLNYITTKNGHEMFNFWDNDTAAREESMKRLRESGTYQINFSGTTTDDIINGNINGTLIIANINGTWSANARSQDFSAAVKSGSEKDILAKKFIEILNKADSYSGSDENNLYLNYENLSMVFYVVPTSK